MIYYCVLYKINTSSTSVPVYTLNNTYVLNKEIAIYQAVSSVYYTSGTLLGIMVKKKLI